MQTSLGDLLVGIGALLAGLGAFIAFTKLAQVADSLLKRSEKEKDKNND